MYVLWPPVIDARLGAHSFSAPEPFLATGPYKFAGPNLPKAREKKNWPVFAPQAKLFMVPFFCDICDNFILNFCAPPLS